VAAKRPGEGQRSFVGEGFAPYPPTGTLCP
jgi:hypothetical protein